MFDRILGRTRPPEEEPASEEEAKEDVRERPRVYYPSPDFGSSIVKFIDSLFEDLDGWSYKAANGDIEAGDRLETMTLARSAILIGILSANRPDVADNLRVRLVGLSRRLDGIRFFEEAMVANGYAIGIALFGRKLPGTSIDYGEGSDAMLSAAKSEPAHDG